VSVLERNHQETQKLKEKTFNQNALPRTSECEEKEVLTFFQESAHSEYYRNFIFSNMLSTGHHRNDARWFTFANSAQVFARNENVRRSVNTFVEG